MSREELLNKISESTWVNLINSPPTIYDRDKKNYFLKKTKPRKKIKIKSIKKTLNKTGSTQIDLTYPLRDNIT